MNDHEAVGTLLAMREHSLSRMSSSYTYGPVPKKERKTASKVGLDAIRLKDEHFQRFYPPGTVVRLRQKDYRIVDAPVDGMVTVRKGDQELKVPVSMLKPRMKGIDKALILDKDDQYLRHAQVDISSAERGCVKGRWKEFGQGQVQTMIQESYALDRIIPYSQSSDLNGLPAETINCEMPDGAMTEGTVYDLLQR